jgi:hypothetical protein
LIFSTIQPVMFVLLFAYVFGGAVAGSLPSGVTYIDFLLLGIFVQSVAFRATQTAVGLSEDLERGVVDRFRSMPMTRSAVLIGRTTADLVRMVLIIVLMIVVGYAIGFRFHAGALQAVASIAVVAAFGLALSWIFAFVALTVRGAEAAQSAVRGDLPAGIRELGVRARLQHAGLAADLREGEPGHVDRQHRTFVCAPARSAELAGRSDRLDRRAPARVHPAVRVAIPPDELRTTTGAP